MKNVKEIQKKLQKIDKKLYIVWGFCRDKILWEKNKGDIDIVTDATPDEMKTVLKIVWEVGKKYGTCIVSEGWEVFELTTFRKDIGSINNRKPVEVEFTNLLTLDAHRRDFTCNAIYLNIDTQHFIDPENGGEDIKKWIIRFVGNIEDRIQEDALRILRFIRFKNKHWFHVAEKKYWYILKKNISILKNIPIERIRQELDKILLHSSNVQALEDLKQIGFFDIFIPELACLDQFPWNKYHLEWNVWIHTMMSIEEMNIIIQRETEISQERQLLLLWTILLHDIWKWPTFSVWEDGESHYYNHEKIWAEMFKKDITKRLKFSYYFEKRIYFLIQEHIRVFKIWQMRKLKSRTLMMQKYFEDLLLIWEADNKWRRPQKLEAYQKILDIYSDFQDIQKTKVFLTGDDIMERYPELVGREIWTKMKQLNDQILVED